MKMQPMLEKQFGSLLLHGIDPLPASPMSIDDDIPTMPFIGSASALGTGSISPADRNAPRTKNINKRRIGPHSMRAG